MSHIYLIGKESQRSNPSEKERAVSKYISLDHSGALDNILNAVQKDDLVIVTDTSAYSPSDIDRIQRISKLLEMKNGVGISSQNQLQYKTTVDAVYKVKSGNLNA